MRARSRIKRGAIALIMLTLVLALAPGGTEWKQASAQQTSSAKQTAPNASVPEPPSVEVQAWALTDAYSGVYLAGENPDEPLPAASTANIMTALVVLEEGVNQIGRAHV